MKTHPVCPQVVRFFVRGVAALGMFVALAFSPAAASAAVGWGINCTTGAPPACPNTGATVAMLHALHASIYRLRIPIPHLLYAGTSYGVGSPATPQQDLDPIAMAAAPDTTTCGVTSYQIKLNTAQGFGVGPVTADFLPTGTTICARSGTTINVTHLPSQFVAAANFYGAVGPGNLVYLLQNPTPPYPAVQIELTAFNPSNPGNAADGPVLDNNGAVCTTTACSQTLEARVGYMLQQVAATGAPAVLLSVGNEEDGGASAKCNGTSYSLNSLADLTTAQAACSGQTISLNGDWGDLPATGASPPDITMLAQIQKMRAECTEAHAYSVKCMDGGLQAKGAQLVYANYLWNICYLPSQLACRQKADIFQQWNFAKSLGQTDFAQGLITSCQYPSGGPTYLNNGNLIHEERALALLTEAARTGVDAPDYWNVHAYELFWQGAIDMWNYFDGLTGKQPVFDEMGIYSASGVDLLRYMNGFVLAHAVYALWWNQAGSHPVPLSNAYSGSDPTQVPLTLPTGRNWVQFITGTAPGVFSGTAPPQPFC